MDDSSSVNQTARELFLQNEIIDDEVLDMPPLIEKQAHSAAKSKDPNQFFKGTIQADKSKASVSHFGKQEDEEAVEPDIQVSIQDHFVQRAPAKKKASHTARRSTLQKPSQKADTLDSLLQADASITQSDMPLRLDDLMGEDMRQPASPSKQHHF